MVEIVQTVQPHLTSKEANINTRTNRWLSWQQHIQYCYWQSSLCARPSHLTSEESSYQHYLLTECNVVVSSCIRKQLCHNQQKTFSSLQTQELTTNYINSSLMSINIGVEMGSSQYIPERTFVTNKLF